MPPAGFEPTTAKSERLQAHALHGAAIAIGFAIFTLSQMCLYYSPSTSDSLNDYS